MKSRWKFIYIISLLLILVIIGVGCGESEYAKAEATKLGISFSFEYPPSYQKITADTFEDNGREPSLSLLYIDPESTLGKADIQIYVILNGPIAGRPDATAWTEEHIKLLEEGDDAFVLYEWSTVNVSGISAYKVVYFSSLLGNYLNSNNLIIREVYFDYRGFIWKISVLAVEEFGDQAEAVFEHVIESFNIKD
jgi:hypothetical protein